MSYDIPDGCNINFNIFGTYSPPICGAIEFIFYSGEVDPNIISENITLRLNINESKFFHGDVIVIDNVSISSIIGHSIVDILLAISTDNITINSAINNSIIGILPDIIISGITINSFIGNSEARGTEEQFLPNSGGSGIIRMPWSKTEKLEENSFFRWERSTEIDLNNIMNILPPKITDDRILLPWDITKIRDGEIISPIETGEAADKEDIIKWGETIPRDSKVSLSVDTFYNRDNEFIMRIISPDEADRFRKIAWDTPTNDDINFKAHSRTPGSNDREHITLWGPFSYYTLCHGKYRVPEGCELIFEFPNKHDLNENVCKDITFYLDDYNSADIRCKTGYWYSGGRDAYTNTVDPYPTGYVFYPTDKGIYHMINTITVEEVITGSPIEILSFEASTDIDSWLWSYSITIASKCHLDLIRPVNGVLGQLKIILNGWIFYCTVESWSESRQFGSQSWTINGRSPSMMFGSPVAQKESNIINSGFQGAAIISNLITSYQAPFGWPAELEIWELDTDAYVLTQTGFNPASNWYIPEKTVSYSDKTGIEVVKEMVESIGAYIQTDPGENKIKMAPKFPNQPWNWNLSNGDITWKGIIEAQCVEIGQSNQLKPYVQGVYVIGESPSSNDSQNGVDSQNRVIAVEIIKNGYTSGSADFAPMITSKYVTTSPSALESGRTVLADQGEWINHTIRFGYLCNKTDDASGMFNVGDMTSVMERGVPWFGQCIGVSIVAVSTGAGGVQVEQVLEIREYKGG